MKMAKASERDMNIAMSLANYCDALSRGHMPDAISNTDEIVEYLDSNDCEQYARLLHGLQDLLDKGSISRVVWGMSVLLDPLNEVVDPDADTLEDHPNTVAANKDAERYRWLKTRLMGADFDWNESGACALVFEWPKDCQVSANCDRTIDDAMLKTQNVELRGAEPASSAERPSQAPGSAAG